MVMVSAGSAQLSLQWCSIAPILSWINELVVRMEKERKKWGEMGCSDAVKEREEKEKFKKINRMQELKKDK